MTAALLDPLIATMNIRRVLPLHESSQRMRELCPADPRVYGVAVMSDVSRRRWWPLAEAVVGDRLQVMYDGAVADTGNEAVAAHQVAAMLVHVVIGRVVPLLVLEGRAWDPGLENLWVHVDSEAAIDWVGVVEPTLRVLPGDPIFGGRGAPATPRIGDGVVALPGEAALTTWLAHRCHRALEPLFARLSEVSGGVLAVSAMWHMAGSAVVGAATQVPVLAGIGEADGMRRAQAVLDALVGFGVPVRGRGRASLARAC
ncbi:iron reductase [Mycobacterium sp. CBMA293]|uniref:iron reductase n=1 Tax=unclassified Mycolicibacterium TaxID=2636767 RepID=UPI0013292990|nr:MULTISPECIES: iron reductase [unclassified Mycolicibacterium]MUL49141.1 iron reductase [Mycolicibacterium sp. CBMA 360]MUL97335.1 iron reductase [Mycolicibacterium sp. CBMA 230]MUL62690.1 iron reductase [Mycolicibacterium sp. CBMA 335]MUL71591.1 iron reductase [Mycolicibacterium sp. CBMA 311]MUM04126.1 iron reductase [Mycolicibacterium sp. CBMA 213]